MDKNLKTVEEIQAERKAQKLERKAAEKKAAKKASTKNTIIVVCVILLFALAIALFAYKQIITSGIIERNTTVMATENYEVDASMMTYFFNTVYQNFAGQYGDYLSSFGLDTSKSLKEQTSMDGTSTWYDYFMDSAKSQAEQLLVLCEGAKAAGVELDADDYKAIDDSLATYKETASGYGMTANAYAQRIFGTAVKLKDMKKCLELSQLAAKYSTKLSNDYEISEDEIQKYFDDNADTYTYVDYVKYAFAAVADSDGNYSEEDKAAMKEKSDALLSTTSVEEFKEYVRTYLIEKGKAEVSEGVEFDETTVEPTVDGTLNNHVTKSNAGTAADWAFAAKVGDTYVDANDETGSYTVYMLAKEAYKDDYTTKNAAYIFISDDVTGNSDESVAKANEIIAEWEASDKTEATFLAMTEKYSDAGKLTETIKNVKNDQPFSTPLYKEDAKVGDVESVVSTDQGGVFVVYNAGDGDMTGWQADCDSALRDAKYQDDLTALQEQFAITTSEDGLNRVFPVSLGSSN